MSPRETTSAPTAIDGTPRSAVKRDPPLDTDAQIAAVGEAVLAGTHPYENWTHMAHCATTIYLLRRRPGTDLEQEMPGIIRRYNDAVGVENTEHSGYHETLTQFYLRAIHDLLKDLPENAGLADCVAALKASPLAAREFVFRFYSPRHLFKPEARAGWAEPDRAALPF